MKHHDICIVGGGFTGLGVGIESLKQGLSTILFEKENTLGAKASKNSLQIIHGGFRYLQNADLPRVIESIKAQSDLRGQFPLYTEFLPCILPLESFPSLKSKTLLTAASFFYDVLYSQFGTLSQRRTHTLAHAESSHLIPYPEYSPHGVLLWHDILMSNQRMIINSLRDEYLLLGGELRLGVDPLPSAGAISCFCNGVEDKGSPHKEWVLGCNIRITSKDIFKVGTALKSNKRYLFAIPEDNTTHFGTWYFKRTRKNTYEEYAPSHDEVNFILEDLHKSLPIVSFKKTDIEDITWGMLPAMNNNLPLDHAYTYQNGENLHCVSTKFTTFQTQAKKIVRQLQRMHEEYN